MGNCCKKFKDIIYPNPWDGFVVEQLGYNYRTYSVSFDELNGRVKPLVTSAPPTSAASTAPPTPLQDPASTLKPLSPAFTPAQEPLTERDPLLKNVLTASPHVLTGGYKSLSSSPLILGGTAANVPPPPPFSLLAITMQKKINIEY
jgi:hypothetical protein